MGLKIQAYFQTENAAEDVRIKLQAYNARQIEVGELAGEFDRGIPLLVPFAAAAPGSGEASAGYAAAGGTGADNGRALGAYMVYNEVDREFDRDVDRNDVRSEGRSGYRDSGRVDYDSLNYTLTAEVNPEDYEEAVDLIRHNNGHVEILK